MTALRYMAVVVIGSVTGLLWAVIFVYFVPKWYEYCPVPVGLLLLFLPLLVHFVCGLCARWWNWVAALTYSVVAIAWWMAGGIRNELLFCGNLSHVYVASFVVGDAVIAALLVGSWRLGRLVQDRRSSAVAQ